MKPEPSPKVAEVIKFTDYWFVWGLIHFAQGYKMETATKGIDARLANRQFLVFDFRTFWRLEFRQSARKSKTKNGRIANLVESLNKYSYSGNTGLILVKRRNTKKMSWNSYPILLLHCIVSL